MPNAQHNIAIILAWTQVHTLARSSFLQSDTAQTFSTSKGNHLSARSVSKAAPNSLSNNGTVLLQI
eukprot:1240065-Amphidinium_carterae.1